MYSKTFRCAVVFMRVLTPINMTVAGSDTNVLTYAYGMLSQRPEAAKFQFLKLNFSQEKDICIDARTGRKTKTEG